MLLNKKVILGYCHPGMTFFFLLFFYSCVSPTSDNQLVIDQTSLVVLGIAQDAGYPQVNCQKECCAKIWKGEQLPQRVASVGIVDPANNQFWIVDATPDFKYQLKTMQSFLPGGKFAGIFLTHAHSGHYTGLLELGREAWGASTVPVYVMPRMKKFLEENGPWDQLVSLNNIDLIPIAADQEIQLSDSIVVKPFLVPHRDEYSETVGYEIAGPNKRSLFIPDIDKWEKWDRDIIEEVRRVDLALLDGTFFDGNELPGRDVKKIPHPFIIESMRHFEKLSAVERSAIFFIHLNHTNRLLWSEPARDALVKSGLAVASDGLIFLL